MKVALCPLCRCPVQRTPRGSLHDGLRSHYKTVHPGKAVPILDTG